MLPKNDSRVDATIAWANLSLRSGGTSLKDLILGFLDKDAFNRACATLGIKANKPDLQDTLKSYTDTVKEFYNLMDKLYQDVSTNNQS